MRVIILAAAIVVYSTQAWAQEISCPEGTFKGEEPVQNNVHVVFCQKWVQTGGGLVSKPKKELMRHGPYRIYEKVDPAFMKFQLLLTGQFEDGKPAGLWKQLYEGGETKAEFKVTPDIRAHGEYVMFYPDGRKKATGEYDNGNPSSNNWKFLSREGTVLAKGDFDTVKKAMDEHDTKENVRVVAQAQQDQRKQAEDRQKALSQIKKNWVEKKEGAITTWLDKKSKRLWTGLVGTSNYYNGSLKCQGLKMRLATGEELQTAYDNGLMEVASDLMQPLWTGVDNTSETDPQRSLILGDHSAWQFIPGQGEVPANKLKDQGAVICTK